MIRFMLISTAYYIVEQQIPILNFHPSAFKTSFQIQWLIILLFFVNKQLKQGLIARQFPKILPFIWLI